MANRKATPEETAARFGNGLVVPGPQLHLSNEPTAFDIAVAAQYVIELTALKEKKDAERTKQLLDENKAKLLASVEAFKKDSAGKTWEQVAREYDETLAEAYSLYQAGLGEGKNVLQIQAELLDKLKSR